MDLVFGRDLDGPVWLGADEKTGTWGRAWCGPKRLVEALELQVGLSRPAMSALERAARAVPYLPDQLAPAAAVDPIAFCQAQLAEADLLKLHQVPEVPQTQALLALCAAAPPGLPDRIEQLLQVAPQGVDTLSVVDPPEALAPAWRALFDHLARHGVTVTHDAPHSGGARAGIEHPPARPTAALALAACDPWVAGERLARTLADSRATQTVIIGSDAIVEAALTRHDLLNAPADVGLSAGARLAGLAIDLSLTPADPAAAVAYLTQSPALLPKELVHKLLGALKETPSLVGEDWREVCEGAKAKGEAYSRALARLNAILTGVWPREEALSTDSILPRLAELARIFADDAGRQSEAVALSLDTAARILGHVRALVEACCCATLPLSALRRLCQRAGALASRAPRTQGSTGPFLVAGPGAILAPAAQVVWWNATAADDAAVRLPRLGAASKRMLAGRVEAATLDRGRAAATRTAAWQAALAQAQEQVVLAAWARDACGREVAPHTLFERYRAAESGPDAHQDDDASAPPPRPPQSFVLQKIKLRPGEIRRPGKGGHTSAAESPTSLDSLLGCSLKWALDYIGDLSTGPLPDLRLTAHSKGTVAHKVLELALRRGVKPDRKNIENLFDEVLPSIVSSAMVPAGSIARRTLRLRVQRGITALLRLKAQHGWKLARVEKAYPPRAGQAFPLKGNPDMVLTAPTAIIDLKTGSASDLIGALSSHTAAQLAIYSFLVAPGGDASEGAALPPAGYFLLDDAQLITAGAIAGGCEISPSLEKTWERLVEDLRQARAHLRDGDLVAGGNVPKPSRGEKKHLPPTLGVEAPCHYCNYAFVCGRRTE